MGSDDLFHKRKLRNAASLRREEAKKAPYDRVLIVCEGEKTEPNYLEEIRDSYRLNTANIDICGEECGSDPLSVVNHAIKKYKKDKGYDRVYCVIDRDKHTNFNAAMDKLRSTKLGKDVKFIAVVSIPCFEFWLLLHFGYTDKPYACKGKKSVGTVVVSDLKKKPGFEKYDKGMAGVFNVLLPKLEPALKHAKQLAANPAEHAEHPNPSTQVHLLVNRLKSMANGAS